MTDAITAQTASADARDMSGLIRIVDERRKDIVAIALGLGLRYGYVRADNPVMPGVVAKATDDLCALLKSCLLQGLNLLDPLREPGADDPVLAFGSRQASQHRRADIAPVRFLGFAKHLRRAFQEVLRDNAPSGHADIYQLYAGRFFDRLEMGFIREWTEADTSSYCRLETELQAGERRYRELIDNINLGLAVIEPDYTITLVNAAVGRLFLKDAREMVGAKCYREFAKRDTPCPQCRGPEAMRQETVLEIENLCVRDDGTVFDARLRFFPHRDLDGRANGFIDVFEDISDRKRYEIALLRAKEAAEAADRAKDDFLANMSHEIRTPLNAIMGMTELTLETELDATQRDYLSDVRRSARHLRTIINDVLDLSHIASGKFRLVEKPFEPQPVTEGVFRSLQPSARAKDLACILDFDPAVPPRLTGDPARISQILYNLLGNAIKFTDQGRVTLSVRLASGAPPGKAMLDFAVSDTGPGIAPEHHQTVFESFSQVDSSLSRRAAGTGLGLTISRRLAELMGGRLTLFSKPGQGSVFTLSLPLTVLDVSAVQPRPQPGNAPARRSLRILLAEDNPVNQKLAVRLLEKQGHGVQVAANGAEALAALGKSAFDIVLMDIQMPGIDGMETTRLIREGRSGAPRDLPIVAMTAHAMLGDKERFLEIGMTDYISKPIEAAKLREVLDRVILHPAASE